MSHPSFLQLDRHAVGVRSVEVEAHIAGCSQCAAHLTRLSLPTSVPESVRDAVKPRPFWSFRRAGLLVPVAALALLVLFIPPEEDVRSKGVPAVAVFVKRAGAVTRWDGKQPLAAGDGVRLEVAPADFAHVTVLQAGAVLYEAEIHGPQLLPTGWELDAAPGSEKLDIVFSHAALTEDDRKRAPTAGRTARLWVISLVLPKEPAR